MRVLVTGARGFVGAHLVAALVRADAEVDAADRELEITDAAAVESRLRRSAPDALVHLAAQSSVAASLRDPAATWRTNYAGSAVLLRAAAARAPRARVLWVGSGEAYGPSAPQAEPHAEQQPFRPVSPYARSKASADLLAARFAARGLDVVRARPFAHLGPGQADAFAASSFARQIAECEAGLREPVLEVGNLDSARDYLDVRDVVDAYLRLLDPAVPAGAYNVASGRATPLREIAEALLARARLRIELCVRPERVRPTDVLVGDAGKLRRATGFAPRIPLPDALAALLDDWRRRISASS